MSSMFLKILPLGRYTQLDIAVGGPGFHPGNIRSFPLNQDMIDEFTAVEPVHW